MRRQAMPHSEWQSRQMRWAIVGGLVAAPVAYALFVALLTIGEALR